MQETKWDKRKAQTLKVSKLIFHLASDFAYRQQLILDTIQDMVNVDNIKHG